MFFSYGMSTTQHLSQRTVVRTEQSMQSAWQSACSIGHLKQCHWRYCDNDYSQPVVHGGPWMSFQGVYEVPEIVWKFGLHVYFSGGKGPELP